MTNLLVRTEFAEAGRRVAPTGRGQAGRGFESILADAANRERAENINNGSSRSTQRATQSEPTARPSQFYEQNPNAGLAEAFCAEHNESGACDSELGLALLPEILLAEEEVLEEVAAIFGISPAELAQILDTLGIKPYDLADKEYQVALMLAVYDLETELALLDVPDSLTMMQAIEAAVAVYAPVAQAYYATAQAEPILSEIALIAPEVEVEAVVKQAAGTTDTGSWFTNEGETQMPAKVVDIARDIGVEQGAQPMTAFNPMLEAAAQLPRAELPILNQPVHAPVEPQQVLEQIVQNMKFEVRGDMAEIRIALKPDHLGEVSLRIASHNGVVTAQFVAESQRIKEIIEAGFNQLRDALAEQGINIADIEVSVNAGDGQERENHFQGSITPERIQDLIDAALADEEVQPQDIAREGRVDVRV